MVFFNFIQILKETSVSNSGPDQMPHFVASDLVLHCLPMSHKKKARLIWVKITKIDVILSITIKCILFFLCHKV